MLHTPVPPWRPELQWRAVVVMDVPDAVGFWR
jgi:hypothetical protein